MATAVVLIDNTLLTPLNGVAGFKFVLSMAPK
jgi:hypothetical protein